MRKNLAQVIAIILLIGAIALLLSVLNLAINPGPLVLDAEREAAQVHFWADRRWVLGSGECVNVRWDVAGIQAVYLNGEGQAGTGEQQICADFGITPMPELRVVFQDGESRVYRLNVDTFFSQPEPWLLLGVALGIVLLAGSLGNIPWLSRHLRHVTVAVLVLGAAANVALLGVLSVHPDALTVDTRVDEAQVFFAVDRQWFAPGVMEDLSVRWDVTGTRAVYLDDEGVTGSGVRQVSVIPNRPHLFTLRVVFQDDTERVYGLNIAPFSWQVEVWLWLAVTTLMTIAAAYLVDQIRLVPGAGTSTERAGLRLAFAAITFLCAYSWARGEEANRLGVMIALPLLIVSFVRPAWLWSLGRFLDRLRFALLVTAPRRFNAGMHFLLHHTLTRHIRERVARILHRLSTLRQTYPDGQIWRFDRLNREVIALILLVTFFYCVQVFSQMRLAPSEMDFDMTTYAIALLQVEDPDMLTNDTLYGDRHLTGNLHPVYMFTYSNLFRWAGYDLALAGSMYRMILIAIYMPGMFFFLFALLRHWLLAFMIAVLTSGVSTFSPGLYLMATGTSWTLGRGDVLPFMVYTAVTPWLGWALLANWFKPGWRGRQIVWWRVFLVGLLVGFSTHLHSINAVALIEITFGVALIQTVRKKLPFWTVIVFALGVGPGLLMRMLNTPGFAQGISVEGAQRALYLGKSMVFPWGRAEESMHLLFFMHVGVSLVLGLAVWRTKRRHWRQFWLLALVTTQALYANQVLLTSWIYPGLLFLYGWYLVLEDKGDDLDQWSFITLVLALLSGPFQQMLLYDIWRSGVHQLLPLTDLIYQMARFAHLAYLPFLVLISRALLLLLGPVFANRWGALFIVIFAVEALREDLGVLLTLPFAILIGWGAMILWRQRAAVRERSIARLSLPQIMVFSAAIVVFTSYFGLFLPSPAIEPVMSSDSAYNELALWAREQTPEDSLFYGLVLDRRFRFDARRATTVMEQDVIMGIATGQDPLLIEAVVSQMRGTVDNPHATIELATELHANYVVLSIEREPLPLDAIFENEAYVVYELPK